MVVTIKFKSSAGSKSVIKRSSSHHFYSMLYSFIYILTLESFADGIIMPGISIGVGFS